MNHIYRIIWNASLGAWIAVSENTKSKTKTKSKSTVLAGPIVGLLGCVGIAVSPSAMAGVQLGGGSVSTQSAAGGNWTGCWNIPGLGPGVNQAGTSAGATNAIAIGGSNSSGGVGSAANAGDACATTIGSIAMGYGASTNALPVVGSPAGQSTPDQVNLTYKNAIAIGEHAKATGDRAIGIGSNSWGSGTASVVMGSDASPGAEALPGYTAATGNSVLPNNGNGRSTQANQAGGIAIGSGARANVDSSATGTNGFGIALGYQAASWEAGSDAIGLQATSNAVNGIALGTLAGVGAGGNESVAIGHGSYANTSNSAALGHNSVTSAPTGNAYLTNQAANATNGTISVGAVDTPAAAATSTSLARPAIAAFQRRIQNVADGAADTDAVTVAQLKQLNSNGLNFTDASGTNVIHKDVGGKLPIIGSTTDGSQPLDNSGTYTPGIFTSKNVQTVADPASGKLQIQFSDAPVFNTVTAAQGTTASSSLSADGLRVTNGPSVLSTGINAGNQKITNLTAGTNPTDGVNVSQLNQKTAAATTEVKAGKNITTVDKTTDATDGHSIYTVNAKGTTASAASTAVTVTPGAQNADGVTDYAVDLSQQSKDSLNKVNTSGLTFNGDSGTTGIKKLGDTVGVTGDSNITTVANSSGVQVKLNPDVTVNSLTAGNSLLNTNGLTITNGPSVLSTGINAGNKKITNLTAGTDPTDGVNVSQLNQKTAAATTEVKAGKNITSVDKSADATDGHSIYTVNAKGTTASAASNAVTVTPGAQNADGITDYAVDLSQQSKDSLSKVENTGLTFNGDSGTTGIKKLGDTVAVTGDSNITTLATDAGVQVKLNPDVTVTSLTAGNTLINNDGLTIKNGPSVLSTGIDAGSKKITNLAAGTNPTDGVNVSQLNQKTAAATTEVQAGKNITSVDKSADATDGHSIYTVNAKGTTASAASNAVTVTPGAQNADGITDYAVDLSQQSKDSLNKVDTSGLTFNGDSGTTGIKKLGDTVGVTGDSNITTVASASGVQVKLNPDVTVNSLTAGNSLLNTNGLTIQNGPSVLSTGIDAGSKKITNLAAGTNPTDGVNVSQLNQKAAAASTEVQAGKNITSVDKTTDATDGHSIYTVNAKGTTASAGSTAVTVTPGAQNADGITDYAVDLSQQTKGSLDKVENSGLTFNGDSGTTGIKKLGDTVGVTGDSNITTVASASGVQVKLNPDVTVNSLTAGNSLLNTNGLTITNGPSVLSTGIDAGSKKITNLAAGTNPTDGVNVSQLNQKAAAASTEVQAGKNITSVDKTTDATDGHSIYTVNAKGTTASAGSSAVTVTPGAQNADGITDYAVDLSDASKASLNKVENSGLTFNGDSGTTGIKKLGDTVGVTGDSNITTLATDAGVQVKLNPDVTVNSLTAGNSLLNTNGLTIQNGPSVLSTGIDAGSKKITNLAAGTNPTDGVNVSQLNQKAAAASTEVQAGKNITSVDKTTDATDGHSIYTVNAKGTTASAASSAVTVTSGAQNADGITDYAVDLSQQSKDSLSKVENTGLTFNGDSGTTGIKKLGDTVAVTGDSNITTLATDAGVQVKLNPDVTVTSLTAGNSLLNTNGLTIQNGPSVLSTGIDAGSKKITNLAAGTNPTDGVNVSQLNQKAAAASTEVQAGKNITSVDKTTDATDGHSIYTVNAKGTTASAGSTAVTVTPGAQNADGITDYAVDLSQQTKGSLDKVENSGLTFNGDSGTTGIKKLGDTVAVTGDSNITTLATDAGVQVKLNPDVTVTSLTAGNTLINNDGLTIKNGPSVLSTGIDAGSKKITNLAAGTNPTDGVNVSQLNQKAAAASTEVQAGKNITSVDKTTDATDGHSIYTVNAKGTTASAASNAVTVTPGAQNADGITDYAVDLSQQTKGSLKNGDSALQSIVTQVDGKDVKTINKANNTANFVTGDNIALTANSDGSITVATQKDVKFDNVTTNNLTATGDTKLGDQFTVNKDGAHYTGPITAGDNIVNKDYVDQAATGITDKGLNFNANSGNVVHKNLGDTLGIIGSGEKTDDQYSASNVKTTTDANGNIVVMLDKNLNTDSLVLNGKDGINGAPGTPGLSIKGETGAAGVNGKDGDTTTRLVYTPLNADGTPGAPEQVATLNDGLKFAGNQGNLIAKKMNETLTIKGNLANSADATAENTRVDSADGNLVVKMAKDLKDLNSVATNNLTATGDTKLGDYFTVNKDGAHYTGPITAGDNIVNKDYVDQASASSKTEVEAGKNMTVQSHIGANGQTIYNVATADKVDFDQVTVGSVKVDKNNVDGAGNTKVTGVGAGDLNSKSTDAVNGSQLYATNQIVNNLSQGFTLQTNGANATAVKASDTVDIGTQDGEQNLTVSKSGNTIKYGLNRDLNVDSVKAGNNTLNSKGLIIDGGPSITSDGIDANGKVLSNVAAGIKPTDAVNVSQLTNVVAGAKTEVEAGKNMTVQSHSGANGQTVYNVATADKVNFDQVTVGSVKVDKNNVDAAGNTKVTGVGAGDVNSKSTDAVNGAQLYQSNQNVASYLGGGATVNERGQTTAPTYNVNGNTYNNVGDALGSLDQKVTTVGNQLEQAFYSTNNRIDHLENRMNAGTAQALAAAGLPQSYIPGKSMMAISGGTYRGETGYAIGLSTISDSGRWVFKVNGSGDSRGDFGGSVGAGIQW